jgi:hypothetical protein
VLQQDVTADGAYNYAARHGESARDYLALKQALPPPGALYGSMRYLALRDMRARLRLDDDGNPLAK